MRYTLISMACVAAPPGMNKVPFHPDTLSAQCSDLVPVEMSMLDVTVCRNVGHTLAGTSSFACSLLAISVRAMAGMLPPCDSTIGTQAL